MEASTLSRKASASFSSSSSTSGGGPSSCRGSTRTSFPFIRVSAFSGSLGRRSRALCRKAARQQIV